MIVDTITMLKPCPRCGGRGPMRMMMKGARKARNGTAARVEGPRPPLQQAEARGAPGHQLMPLAMRPAAQSPAQAQRGASTGPLT